MRLAIPSTGTDTTSLLDDRFGRAERFLVVDADTGESQLLENTDTAQASQGAGIQAAQAVVSAKAEAVLAGHVGPKAFKVLDAAGIAVFQAPTEPIDTLLAKFRRGELPRLQGPDRKGHE